MHRWILATASLLSMAAVIIGAFGAHALKGKIETDMLRVYETGVLYHFLHALALGLVGLAANSDKYPHGWLKIAAILFIVGIVLFSGSLYALSVIGIRRLGMVTPLGGLTFGAGWIALTIAALKS